MFKNVPFLAKKWQKIAQKHTFFAKTLAIYNNCGKIYCTELCTKNGGGANPLKRHPTNHKTLCILCNARQTWTTKRQWQSNNFFSGLSAVLTALLPCSKSWLCPPFLRWCWLCPTTCKSRTLYFPCWTKKSSCPSKTQSTCCMVPRPCSSHWSKPRALLRCLQWQSSSAPFATLPL